MRARAWLVVMLASWLMTLVVAFWLGNWYATVQPPLPLVTP
jgi:hypothetical protein